MANHNLASNRVECRGVAPHSSPQVLALSSRSWLSYNYQGRYQMTPLSYDPLDYAAEFSTEMCPEGVVAVSGEKLRIFGVERLGEVFNQAALPLR